MIAKLKEVVGDLLIYIDFVLEFFTKFQSFSLVIYGFFIVFEALQISRDEFKSLQLGLYINITGSKGLENDRKLLI